MEERGPMPTRMDMDRKEKRYIGGKVSYSIFHSQYETQLFQD